MISVFQGQYIQYICFFINQKSKLNRWGIFSTVIQCEPYMLLRRTVSWKKASSQLNNSFYQSIPNQSIPFMALDCITIWLLGFLSLFSPRCQMNLAQQFAESIRCRSKSISSLVLKTALHVFYARFWLTETPS